MEGLAIEIPFVYQNNSCNYNWYRDEFQSERDVAEEKIKQRAKEYGYVGKTIGGTLYIPRKYDFVPFVVWDEAYADTVGKQVFTVEIDY